MTTRRTPRPPQRHPQRAHRDRRPWAAVAAVAALLVVTVAPAQAAVLAAPTTISIVSADALKAHNDARSEAGTDALVWDEQLATEAQAWSDTLASQNRGLRHSTEAERQTKSAGENLSWWSGYDNAQAATLGTQGWYGEKAAYEAAGRPPLVNLGPLFFKIGHYTQMIWADTQKVGCGASSPSGSTDVYFTCRYYPPGNYARSPYVKTITTAASTPSPSGAALTTPPFGGDLGTALKDGKTSGTATATATAAPTTTTAPGPSSSAPASTPSTSSAQCTGTGASKTGDLPFGSAFDTLGNGCIEVKVTALDEFTPSSPATITGTAVQKYRSYEVDIMNNGTTALDGTTAVRVSCWSGSSTPLPLVLDPQAGQGLPNANGLLGSGRSHFAVGCGQDVDGYAHVSLQFGPELGNGALSWYLGAVPVPEPSASATTAAPATTCPDATSTGLSGTRAATALRCVVDQARASQGLPKTMTNDKADLYAGIATGTNRINPSNVCSGLPPKNWGQGYTPGETPQQAFEAAGGMGNESFKSTTLTYLGLAYANNRYGLFSVVC